MNSMNCSAPAPSQRGDTLIEVLVTMVVLAFSLLGLAGLLNQTTNMAQESSQRTAIVQHIYAFADRMRANATGVNAGNYDSLSGTASNPSCGTACTESQMATVDYYEWTRSLQSGLGASASGSVQRIAGATGPSSLFTITVNWTDVKLGPQTYSLTIRPL